MKVKGSQVGWGFWPGWVLASSVGWIIGFLLSTVLGLIFVGGDNGISLLGSILGYFIGGAAQGFGVGLMQWLVLRRRVSRAGWWILASTAGFSVVGGIGFGAADVVFGYLIGWGEVTSLTNLLGRTMVVALGGAVTGILQWLVLRRQVSRAGWWVLASTVGWGLCAAVAWAGIRLLELDYETLTPTILLLVGGGAVLGAVTGGALVWLLRQSAPEAQLEG